MRIAKPNHSVFKTAVKNVGIKDLGLSQRHRATTNFRRAEVDTITAMKSGRV